MTIANKKPGPPAGQSRANPFIDLVIPETWANVQEFGDWWISSKMPMKIPNGSEVFLSDDATAICLFRQGRFQIELYLIHPTPNVPTHEHPGVEVIKVRTGLESGNIWLSPVLRRDEAHGSGMKLEAEVKGFPLVAIQHWQTREPTTIASMWKGKTAGPKHEGVIKRFNPGCFVEDGYADITRNADGSVRDLSGIQPEHTDNIIMMPASEMIDKTKSKYKRRMIDFN